MSIFDNNIKSKTITEIILGKACDIYKKDHGKLYTWLLGRRWRSWDKLYIEVKKQPMYSANINHYIEEAVDEYFKETGKLYEVHYDIELRNNQLFARDISFVEIDKPKYGPYGRVKSMYARGYSI